MKRLNIKSVFKRHPRKDGLSWSSDSNDFNLEEEFRAREKQMAEKMEESSDLCRSFTGSDQTTNGGVAFPEMKLPGTFRNGSVEDQNSTEGDEEEIDDDEEGALQISHSQTILVEDCFDESEIASGSGQGDNPGEKIKRIRRCGECKGCRRRKDCGKCSSCQYRQDRLEFGGHRLNKPEPLCIWRICEWVYPLGKK